MLYLQILVNGIVAGSAYALAAQGFNLIYGTTRIFHVAYGSTLLVALYVATTISVSGPSVYLGLGVGALLALVIGGAVYLGLYAPLERLGRSRTIVFVASLGLTTLLGSVIPWVFGSSPRNIALPWLLTDRTVGGVQFSPMNTFTVVGAIALSFALWSLLRWSRFGRHLRGITSNGELGNVMGMRRGRLLTYAFALGSIVGFLGLAAQAMASAVTPNLGLGFTLVAAIVVLGGGAGSLVGSYAIAMALGVAQEGLTLVVSASWATVIIYAALIIFMITRPSGLVGAVSKRIL